MQWKGGMKGRGKREEEEENPHVVRMYICHYVITTHPHPHILTLLRTCLRLLHHSGQPKILVYHLLWYCANAQSW